MASVEFCKIPPLPWPAMASMVSWTPIESIGWTLFFGSPWKWSPNTPWKWQWNSRNSMEISETGVVQQMHVLPDVF